MVGDYGEVYLIDWGLAAEATMEQPCEPGGFAGTPVYASPEMIARTPRLDPRTDVYLLGATLYHVLTGRAPHQGWIAGSAGSGAGQADTKYGRGCARATDADLSDSHGAQSG